MKKDFIFNDVNKLKGVGPQLSKYLKKKKIEQIKDEHCLYNIAIGSSNIDIAVYAIHRVSDLSLLAKIKNNAKNKRIASARDA